jgi:hypothetical protein
VFTRGHIRNSERVGRRSARGQGEGDASRSLTSAACVFASSDVYDARQQCIPNSRTRGPRTFGLCSVLRDINMRSMNHDELDTHALYPPICLLSFLSDIVYNARGQGQGTR